MMHFLVVQVTAQAAQSHYMQAQAQYASSSLVAPVALLSLISSSLLFFLISHSWWINLFNTHTISSHSAAFGHKINTLLGFSMFCSKFKHPRWLSKFNLFDFFSPKNSVTYLLWFFLRWFWHKCLYKPWKEACLCRDEVCQGS